MEPIFDFEFKRTFRDEQINKTCRLFIVTEISHIESVRDIIKKFNDNTHKILSFDLEFNNDKKRGRYISLFQLGFYFETQLIIIFFDPNTTPTIMPIIIPLLTDMSTIKIGHGTDSLDLPQINLLLSKNEMIDFIRKLYDTRYLCEYVNMLGSDNKCNVYHCLDIFNVINQEQIDFLHGVEEKLGKFWLKSSNIKTLSEIIITYAMYDVVYLKKLLHNLKQKIEKHNLDYNLCLQFTRLLFLSRLELIKPINVSIFNTMLKDGVQMKQLFDNHMEAFTQATEKKYKMLITCSAFKKFVHIILLVFFYKYMIEKYDVYKSSKQIITKNDIDILKKQYNIMVNNIELFPCIIKFIQEFQKTLLNL